MMRRLVAAALVAAAGAGCGGGDDAASRGTPAPAKAEPVGSEVAGSVAQYADCRDWRAGTRAERLATIEELRGQFTPQASRRARSPLSDRRAYAILDKACAPDYAERLRLYKVYVRAQAFASLADE